MLSPPYSHIMPFVSHIMTLIYNGGEFHALSQPNDNVMPCWIRKMWRWWSTDQPSKFIQTGGFSWVFPRCSLQGTWEAAAWHWASYLWPLLPLHQRPPPALTGRDLNQEKKEISGTTQKWWFNGTKWWFNGKKTILGLNHQTWWFHWVLPMAFTGEKLTNHDGISWDSMGKSSINGGLSIARG